MADISSLVDYYVNLLIIQYHDKPKAQATIRLFADTLLASGVYFDVLNGYNVDSAVGVQLDIIGKYVGTDRYFKGQILNGYFAFVTYGENFMAINPNKRGFCDYSDLTKPGKWLTYADIVSTVFTLIDDDFRKLIKMKIFQNNSNHAYKSIDDFLFSLFGADVTAASFSIKTMTYSATTQYEQLIIVAMDKDVLPRPIGVEIIF